MKLIHLADAHLDSKMESKLDKSKASMRRDELLDTFCGIADYADENGVSAVIIAGDLFDTRNVRVGAVNRVKAAFNSHPDVTFIYLKGNHDEAAYFEGDYPGNLIIFDKEGIDSLSLKTSAGKNVNIIPLPKAIFLQEASTVTPDAPKEEALMNAASTALLSLTSMITIFLLRLLLFPSQKEISTRSRPISRIA